MTDASMELTIILCWMIGIIGVSTLVVSLGGLIYSVVDYFGDND